MNPDVSVVIPSFNRPLMLAEAVGSLLSQRDVRFELIVVDDGSSGAVLDTAAATLAQALARSEANRRANSDGGLCAARLERTAHCGAAAARNRGAVLAQAEFLAFLDSDDLWAPAKLSRQLAFMRSARRWALSQTQEIWTRNGQRVNAGLRHRKRAGDIFADSLRTCLISPSAVMIRRELFFAFGGFDRRLGACEDYDLWLRILSRHEMGLLDEPLVTRRAGHSDQLSAITPALDRFRVITLLKLLADRRLEPAKREVTAEVLAEKCRIVAAGLKRRAGLWQAQTCARAAALAQIRWRFGDTRALPFFARAFTGFALATDNFTDRFERGPRAIRSDNGDALKPSWHGRFGPMRPRPNVSSSAAERYPVQVEERRPSPAAASG